MLTIKLLFKILFITGLFFLLSPIDSATNKFTIKKNKIKINSFNTKQIRGSEKILSFLKKENPTFVHYPYKKAQVFFPNYFENHLYTAILIFFFVALLFCFLKKNKLLCTRLKKIDLLKMNSENRLALHLEQTPLAAIEWDKNYNIISWNKSAERIFGYNQEEVLGKNIIDLLVPERIKPEIKDIITILSKNNNKITNINKNLTKDGRTIICQWYNTSLVDSKGEIIAIASLAEDITETNKAIEERERLYDQLRHSDRLATIGQLAASIAHDINEPLSDILGFAELVEKSSDSSLQIKNDTKNIISSALHARRIIKELLIFSRQLGFEKTQTSINILVKEVLNFFESRFNKEGININVKLGNKVPTIFADPVQLKQVIVNLIVNALGAMPNGGEIFIETYLLNHNICFSIRDTGSGIDESILPKIFEPFFTTKDINQGTGLGLTIVKGIVTSCKGSVKVDSVSGKGTTFIIEIPLNQNNASPQHEIKQKVI